MWGEVMRRTEIQYLAELLQMINDSPQRVTVAELSRGLEVKRDTVERRLTKLLSLKYLHDRVEDKKKRWLLTRAGRTYLEGWQRSRAEAEVGKVGKEFEELWLQDLQKPSRRGWVIDRMMSRYSHLSPSSLEALYDLLGECFLTSAERIGVTFCLAYAIRNFGEDAAARERLVDEFQAGVEKIARDDRSQFLEKFAGLGGLGLIIGRYEAAARICMDLVGKTGPCYDPCRKEAIDDTLCRMVERICEESHDSRDALVKQARARASDATIQADLRNRFECLASRLENSWRTG